MMTLARRAGTILIKALTLGVPLCTRASDSELYAIPAGAGNYVRHVQVAGDAREYRLHVPKGYDGSRPLPLVFAFHGSSASAAVIERETSFNELGDSLGFFAVYPEGFHRGWNVGNCCNYSYMKHKDEAAFVMRILDVLSHGLRVDTTAIYATGYSDGGTLSMLLACELSATITAAASVSGTLLDPLPACNLSRPVSMMVIHGTGDHNIPYEGRAGGPGNIRGPHHEHSAPDVAQFWIQHDSCDTRPELAQHLAVIKATYICAGGRAEVVFFSIHNGQHGWPGGGRGWIFSPRPPTDMAASDTIAAFFLRHRTGESAAPATSASRQPSSPR
jgi:polyhydroxybutyrate depolymerase